MQTWIKAQNLFPITIIADLHVGKNLYGEQNKTTGFYPQDVDLQVAMDNVVQKMTTCRSSTLVFAGDLFDKRNPTSNDWRVFNTLLKKCTSICAKIFLCVGNHEDHKTNVTAFEPLKEVALLHGIELVLVDTPMFLTDTTTNFDAVIMPSVSKRWYSGTFNDYINTLNVPKNSLLICHELFQGAVAKHGIDIQNVSNKFELVVAGDVHVRTKIGANIFYCGSLVNVDIDPKNTDPGFVVVSSPGNFKIEKFPVFGIRKIILLSGTCKAVTHQLLESNNPDKVVRLKIIDSKQNIIEFIQDVKKLKLVSKIIPSFTFVDKTKEQHTKKVQGSHVEQFVTYALENKFSEDLTVLGKNILESVNSNVD